MKTTKLFLLLSILLVVDCAHGRSIRVKNFTSLDVGAYGTNLYERITASTGKASLVSTLKGYARLRKGLKLGRRFLFEPSFGTMVPWRSGADGTTFTFLSHLELPLAWHLFNRLKLRVGPGIHWVFVVSSGEVVTLNNGGGTADFYTPSGNSSAFLFTANAGIEFLLSKSISIAADAYVLQIASKERRSVNASLTLGIKL